VLLSSHMQCVCDFFCRLFYLSVFVFELVSLTQLDAKMVNSVAKVLSIQGISLFYHSTCDQDFILVRLLLFAAVFYSFLFSKILFVWTVLTLQG
jgi:hypothetical protein